jgi:hypothetical protein
MAQMEDAPVGWHVVFMGEVFALAVIILSIIAVVRFQAASSLGFQWIIVIAVFYGLAYLTLFLSIACYEHLDGWRFTAPFSAVSPALLACKMTNSLHQKIGFTRFFFNIIPSFALGIHTFANTKGTAN